MNMKTKFLGACAATAFMLSAAPTLAATVVFDSFDDFQSVTNAPTATRQSASTIIGGSYMADSRKLVALNTLNNGEPEAATSLASVGGSLSFSNNDGATGKGKVIYEGVGDISNGANPYFFFEVGFFDNDYLADFRVKAEDTDGGVSEYSEVLAAGFNPFLFFSEFTGTADFNSIAKLTFVIDTTNVAAIPGVFDGGPVVSVDGSLKSIQLNAVPLPASGLLLFGALGGAAALRRRKARKAA